MKTSSHDLNCDRHVMKVSCASSGAPLMPVLPVENKKLPEEIGEEKQKEPHKKSNLLHVYNA